MSVEEARGIWEARSEAAKLLQWLINEKGVLPNLDVGGLATEYARTKQAVSQQESA
jgi:hypothetical protein